MDIDHCCSVWYAKCPNEPEHWLLFDKDTDVQISAQCLFCGPNVIVKIDNAKNGCVRMSERDAGFTTREPKPDEVKGHSEAQAT